MANTDNTELDDIQPDDKIIVEGEDSSSSPPQESEPAPEASAELAEEQEQVQEEIKQVEKKIKEKKAQQKKEDKEAQKEPEEDEDDDDDEDEDAIAERERRKQERAERKKRREKAIERDKLELSFLRERNEQLERRMMAQELRANRQDHYSLEQRIAEAEQRARDAEEVMARAIAEANGEDAAKAMRIRDEARDKLKELQSYREDVAQEAEKKEKELKKVDEKPKVDPMVNFFAQKFVDKYSAWYNPQSGDMDSKLVLLIDQGLVDEGFNPKTEQYWDELDRRVKRYLPHRFEREQASADDERDTPIRNTKRTEKTRHHHQETSEADDDVEVPLQPAPTKKGPVLAQSREHAPTTTRREVYVSKERKEALIAAGVWDDPVLRTRYLKQYQKWDRENASR